MRYFWSLALLLVVAPLSWGGPSVKVDLAQVVVERRADGRDWCVLESQVSAEVGISVEALLKVIEDYESYPRLFPEIRETVVERLSDSTLVTEKVVVSALGIENTNRFTLRLVRTPLPTVKGARLAWTQHWTDGTIDSLQGHWILEDRGTGSTPLVAVTYRARSAIPVIIPGQDAVIRMFLGGETKEILETVFKKAVTR